MAASDPVDRFVEDLFNTISKQSEALLSQHYPVLASKIMPLAILAGMVWLALKVIRVHAGKDPSDVWPWIRALLTLVFVFWGLTWGAGGTKIFHSFTELRDDTVSIFMGGKSIVEYTEFAYDKFSTVAAHLMTASWMNIGIVLLGLLVQLLACVIVIFVLLLKVGSEMGMAITMVLGPLFLPTLMWDSTRSYGMNWFSAMLKFALVGVLLGICVVFSFGIGELFMGSTSATSGLLAIDVAKVEVRQVSACVILELFMLLFLAFGVRPLASALASSGAAGGGLAEMAAGFAMSQIMSKLTGGKGGGKTPDSLTNISNTQASQGKQLDRIESNLSSGGTQGTSSGSGEPSGAGQPGGPGSGSGSGDAGGSGGTGQSSGSDGAKW
jgi:type IV secretion system protein VirB6